MNKLIISTALLAAGIALAVPVIAESEHDDNDNTLTLAVFGDAPYGCKSGECPAGYLPDTPNGPNPGDLRQIEATPDFIKAVNSDPKVRLVIHTGDIHSGSTYCTLAYNQTVFNLWTEFRDPLVYTPGDNEWADCQKSGEGGGVKNSAGDYVDYAAGHPVANLALVRSIFFPAAGVTLGGRQKRVLSQAEAFDPAHPADGEYVENVLWEQSKVVFVTVNIPGGSNNGDDTWNSGAFGSAFAATGNTKSGPQIQEIAQRTAADLRWLEAAFAKAKARGAKGVVIVEQADMWDLDGKPRTHIANYWPFVRTIAALSSDFSGSVLLINGDSHSYRSDNPLQNDAPCVIETGVGTATAAACTDDAFDNQDFVGSVPNFHRLVVHGSTLPLQYTRLTVSRRANYAATATSFGPFRWERVIP